MRAVDYSRDDYHLRRHPEFLGSSELGCAWSHFAELAYFTGVQSGQSVLEFGGGLGTNLFAIAARARVWMVEPAPLGRQQVQAYGITCATELQELGDLTFDYILCRHVLEHVPDPLGVLEQLRSRLKHSGTLTLVAPVEKLDAKPLPEDLDHHLFCWNPRTMTNLLGEAQFQVRDWHFEYYGGRQKLLPVYRLFGGRAYAKLVRTVGRIFRFRELVVIGGIA